MNISTEWKERVSKLFPQLEEGVSLEFTSEVDYNYNCLAWAVSCNTRYFEKATGSYWPADRRQSAEKHLSDYYGGNRRINFRLNALRSFVVCDTHH